MAFIPAKPNQVGELKTTSTSSTTPPQIDISDRLDIPYGLSTEQKLDIYLPSTSGPYPIIIFAHDTNKTGPDKRVIPTIIRETTKLGWAVVSINHKPNNSYENKISEQSVYNFLEATNWIKNNFQKYNLNPNIIIAAGEGAGGQVAFISANTPVYNVGLMYAGVMMFGSPLDMVEIYNNRKEVFRFFDFITCSSDPCPNDAIEKVSPLHLVSDKVPPVYIAVGIDDPVVNENQRSTFEEVYITESRWGQKGLWLDIVAGADHNLHNANFDAALMRSFLDFVILETEE